MYSVLVAIGQLLTATQVNNMRKDSIVSVCDVELTYDNFGRLSTIEYIDVGVTMTLTYERDNRIASFTDGADIWDCTYNAKGLLTNITKQ